MTASTTQSWLACTASCSSDRFPLEKVLYRCPHCNSLVDVCHDNDKLAATSSAQWKTLFRQRRTQPLHTGHSGVWNKKEWVAPHIDDKNIVTMMEGNSPLLPCPELGEKLDLPRLLVKQCGLSHTGSFKDLGMTVLVSHVKHLIDTGTAIPGIACASTGDTSAALAAYCAKARIPCTVLLPAGKISPAQLVQPLAHGAKVVAIDTDFDGCMKLVLELVNKENIYLANSMNPFRLEGQKTVAIELIEQLGWKPPDWIVIPGGNLGNIAALGEGLSLLKQLQLIDTIPKICVAQTQQANPLYKSFVDNYASLVPVQAGPTHASAIRIGNPVSFSRAIKVLQRLSGVVEQASEHELTAMAALADTMGLYCCPHTAVALVAAKKLRAANTIKKDESVVVVSTAAGLKFSRFKTEYHDGTLSDISHYPWQNKPIHVGNNFDQVRKAIL